MKTLITSIPHVLTNPNKAYEGDLKAYFKIVFLQAKNLNNPYHNFRHLFHVLWNCYQAVVYYGDVLTPRQARNLLIAAMFHDFDHIGRGGNDDHNISLAIEGLRKHILDVDRPFLADIERLIQITRFPYTIPADEIDLCGKIIRDADLSQTLSVAWIQQVVFGLGKEWDITPLAVLKQQSVFLGNIKFLTAWAQFLFLPSVIQEKIDEGEALVAILEE